MGVSNGGACGIDGGADTLFFGLGDLEEDDEGRRRGDLKPWVPVSDDDELLTPFPWPLLA